MKDTRAPGDTAPKTAPCLWCGAERPVDVAVCPTCEHAWVDATIDEARDGQIDSFLAAEPGEARTPWRRRRWLPLAAAGAAALVYAVVFWIMWDGTQPETAAVTSTAAPTATASTVPSPASTTAAPVTTAATTTSTTTTTTTTTLPPIEEIPPAIATSDLTLGAFALGPLRLGSSDGTAAGRLAASLGQPDDRFPVGENWGLCPTDTGRALRWGNLSAILRQDASGETLVGYRLRSDPGGPGSTGDLQTISGLRLGDSVATLQGRYARVAFDTLDDGTDIYMVLRSSDGRTLLWGALSDDQVASINSPRPCDGGPFAP